MKLAPNFVPTFFHHFEYSVMTLDVLTLRYLNTELDITTRFSVRRSKLVNPINISNGIF